MRKVIAALRGGEWLTERRLRAYPLIMLAACLTVTAVWVGLGTGGMDPTGKPLGTDFLNVWSASALALKGEAAAIYDYVRHGEAQRAAMGGHSVPYYGWHYPPMFLLVVLPAALMPYGWALLAYLAATFPAYWKTLRAMAPGTTAGLAALAFPGVWVNVGHGQNGFLTTGLMGGGLLLLERRPVLAGVLFGLLAYKPQFGLLLPLVLAAAGRWTSVVAAGATATVAALLSLAVFGVDTWDAFFASLALSRTVVLEQGAVGWHRLQSVFAAVRLLGGGVALAYAVQGVTTVAAAGAAVWVWRRGSGRLAAAALVTATLLATPYVMDYDLVLVALPIAWLAAEAMERGPRPWEKTLLAVAWLLPLVVRQIAQGLMVPLTPLVLGALLAVIVGRVRARS